MKNTPHCMVSNLDPISITPFKSIHLVGGMLYKIVNNESVNP